MIIEELDNNMVRCDESEDYLYERIIDAYKMGMSVIEICRIIGNRRADHVHGLLRRAGKIKPIEKRGPRLVFALDTLLNKELDSYSYSFARWCAGWGFDTGSAERAIRLANDASNPDQYFAALCRDFPECYGKLYNDPPLHLTSLFVKDEHPSVEINWNEDRRCYLARVVEYPEIEESGRTVTMAFKRMAGSYRIKQIDEAITLYQNVLESNGMVAATCFC